MSDDKERAEELLQQSKEQTRKDTEAAVEKDDGGNDLKSLEDAIADAYEAIDEGDISSNLTLRDENLAALFHGLEDADRLAEIGDGAAEALDRDPDDTDTRAGVLRNLVRIGLSEVDESVIESGKEGHRQFIESQTDEF
ncbi:hypothetical protein [Natrinema thermotolerans]